MKFFGTDSEEEARITVTWNSLKPTGDRGLAGIVSKEGIPAFVFRLSGISSLTCRSQILFNYSKSEMTLSPGDKAPDFEVQNESGEIVRLSDFKGRKLVLFFYPRDNTPTCTKEACNLRDNYQTLKDQGYEILGISSDNEKSHQKFINKFELPYSLLADTEKKVHEAYGTWVEKSMYGRKYMGTARVTFVIDENGNIESIIDKVRAVAHTDQILENH